MPDRPNFPIPDDLSPPTQCLCLEIPNDQQWKAVLNGLLAELTMWFNWQRDDAKSGIIAAHYWRELYLKIDWSTMSCCCEQPLIKVNVDGTVSVSTDGGVTYHTDNNADPRYTAPQFPPLTGDDGAEKKCKAANNVVQQLQDIQSGNAGIIGTTTTVLGMAAAAVALAVAVFAAPELIPFLISLFFELAAALLATSSSTYNALFTSDVWSHVLCTLYCHMNDDGSFTQSQFNAITADFDGFFTGNVALTFSSALRAWQLPGLNQSAKIVSTLNLDCSGCDCTCPTAYLWTDSDNVVTPDETCHYHMDSNTNTPTRQLYLGSVTNAGISFPVSPGFRVLSAVTSIGVETLGYYNLDGTTVTGHMPDPSGYVAAIFFEHAGSSFSLDCELSR